MKIIRNVELYGALCDICVDNGRITHIGNVGECDAPSVDFEGRRIYPGLIDIHSHGCIGHDTMEGHLQQMAKWELEHGTTTWYPTTMTMSREDIVRATNRSLEAQGGANMPGFHMEGPFINVKYKGAQNADYIALPDLALLEECRNIKMVTIAPEAEGSEQFIRSCPAVVSIGHTDCSYDVAKRAMECGAKCLTHTYNAMPGIHHRNPGPIGAASDTDGVYAQLICDGKHVHPSAVRMLIRLFGEDRVILISDSMRATGLGDGSYMFGGQTISVVDGYARTEGGALAGSTTNLFDCVRCAISFGIDERLAVKMASENPARLMGLNKGRIEVGYDADFIIVNDDFTLHRAIARGEF